MRTSLIFISLLLVGMLLAGCTGGDSEAETAAPVEATEVSHEPAAAEEAPAAEEEPKQELVVVGCG